jgi:DNA primase
MPASATELTVGDRTVRVSSPDKVYFPEVGLTKIDIVNYVVAVGAGFLPALQDRPVTMERWPGGYSPDAKLSTRESRFGEAFYQKRAPAKGMPDWVETAVITFPSGRTATDVGDFPTGRVALTVMVSASITEIVSPYTLAV